jgi:diaminopimelate epimerase
LYFGKINQDFVSIQMTEVKDLEKFKLSDIEEFRQFLHTFNINTGVPHCCLEISDIDSLDIVQEGRKLRHHPIWGAAGSNINFYQVLSPDHLKVRTYERGVENETYACGTGVTAVAIAHRFHNKIAPQIINISVKGGELLVNLSHYPQKIFLEGKVSNPYQGIFSWSPS